MGAVERADVVLHVGTRLTDFTTGSGSIFAHPHVAFVGVNVCASDAYKLGGTTVVADAKVSLAALQQRMLAEGWSTGADYRAETRSRIRQWLATVDAEVDVAKAGPGRLTQGHVIRLVNAKAHDGDVMIGAAGGTPGDLLKLWRQPRGGSTHIEFGFSCMGHEIPAGIGYRLALRDAVGEVYVMIGDGTYLMANTDLVTAVQDGTKITVIVVVNDGFQSIHGLQRRTTAASMGTEFRGRGADGALDGAPLAVDYAANARSMGCAAFDVDSPDDLVSALGKARELAGPAVIVVRVQPLAELPGSGAWWDVGVAHASQRPQVREIAAEHDRQRRDQRFHG